MASSAASCSTVTAERLAPLLGSEQGQRWYHWRFQPVRAGGAVVGGVPQCSISKSWISRWSTARDGDKQPLSQNKFLRVHQPRVVQYQTPPIHITNIEIVIRFIPALEEENVQLTEILTASVRGYLLAELELKVRLSDVSTCDTSSRPSMLAARCSEGWMSSPQLKPQPLS